MKKAIKWVLILVGILIVLIVSALLIIPLFVDVKQYKPQIEEQVSKATGRPFTLGEDLNLTLFPWAGLSFTGLHLGNPPDFKEKDLLTVKSFEVRVKLLPLLTKDIQVKRFIMEGPRIVLEKNKKGRGNWEGIGKAPEEVHPGVPEKKEKPSEEKRPEGLPIKALAVGEFAVTDGSVLWIDQAKGERREISNVTFRLQDVSLDRPIGLAFSASLDGRPLALEGKMGPLGKEPGKGNIPLDITLKALEQMDMSLKGNIIDPATRQQFDLSIGLAPFSPRKLMKALDKTFPVETADPEALNRMTFKATLKGNPQNISISGGVLDLDDSNLKFSVKAKHFSRPDVTFDLHLDQIDLDRYLPPPSEKEPAESEKEGEVPAHKQKKTDYAPLRTLILDGTVRVDKLKAQGANIQDLYLKVKGKNGLFNLDPLTVKLYQGDMSAKGEVDVREDIPKSSIELRAKKIQAGPLLKDLLKKDFLEGTLDSDVAIAMSGDNAQMIKKGLNGKGELQFKDGSIVGIDLAGMVRNVKATFGLAEKGAERPRTDFSELHVPFTITNGVVKTPQTSLLSPLLRVKAAGKANLVNEKLDFRVEPKFVATLKGQGDKMERSGLMVPVLVTGSFSDPKFRPDLKGMLKEGLKEGIPKPDELKKLLPGQSTEKGGAETLKEKAEGLLKGLPFGN
ncbi:MAG: AsmA family protein [Desulfobacteraceae bacterium]|nr:MAG: AsmA family protein [Desulfobacteraceae bacterium]